MGRFSKDKKDKLINTAKKCIDEGRLSDLEAIMEETSTVVVQKSRWENKIKCVRYELGEHVVPKEVFYSEKEHHNYFGSSEINILLDHALKNNKLQTIEWFMNKGYFLDEKQFASFCRKNPESNDTVDRICDQYLTVAIRNNNLAYTQTVLKNSSHLKDNKELSQRLEIIKPLFSELKDLTRIQQNEEKKNNEQAASTLNAYIRTTHMHIRDFLTNKTTGQAFLNFTTSSASDYMAKLEEKPEGLAVFKNILLCLSVIGPFIKKLDTGRWFYENSTTSKVRETTDRVKEMRASLTMLKSLKNHHEPEQNAEQEYQSQPLC